MIKSYDVFDTLIVRWYKEPDSIFKEIQKLSNINNFTQLRKKAENSCLEPDLNKIYNLLQKYLNLSEEKKNELKNLELSLEHKMSSPIISNLIKIKDGDILVSDMYLQKEEILSILKKNNLNKNIKLYVSNGGKSNGWIWNTILEKSSIETHLGDNYHSDVLSAQNNGIKGIHTTIHEFLDIEKKIFNLNNQIAYISRILRLLNPYDLNTINYLLWNEASHYTITTNILISFFIKNEIDNNNYKNILFSSRDCHYLVEIFKVIFPELSEKVIYFDSSRKMYYEPTEEYIKYASNLMENSIVIDLQGSGKSFKYFCEKNNIKSNYFVVIDTGEDFKNKINIFKYRDTNFSDKIERINYAPYGSLVSYKKYAIRENPEYDVSLLEPYEKVIQECIKLINLKFYLNSDNMRDTLFFILSELEKNIFINKFIIHKDNYVKI